MKDIVWQPDWPTHAERADIAPLLGLPPWIAELIIRFGNLQPDAEGDYSLKQFFAAAAEINDLLPDPKPMAATGLNQ